MRMPRRPLDQGLDDHGGDIGGQLPVQLGQGGGFFSLDLVVADPGGGIGQHLHREQHALPGAKIARGPTHRHGPDGIAVIGALEGQQAGAALLADIGEILQRHLQRHLHRRRAVVGIEHPVQIARHQPGQFGGEAGRRFMGEIGEDHLLQLGSLIGDGLGDARVGMSMHIDPPGRHQIHVRLAVGGQDRSPLAAHRHQGLRRRLLLSKGMPDMATVKIKDFLRQNYASFFNLKGCRFPRLPDVLAHRSWPFRGAKRMPL